MRRSVVGLAATTVASLLAMASPRAATALPIIQAHAFTVSGLAASDAIGVQPFDPALGTLDQVIVTIQGILAATATNFGQLGEPLPIDIVVRQNFSGLGVNKYFRFGSDGIFLFSGSGSASFIQPFEYIFRFTDVTDLVGSTILTTASGVTIPPTSIIGRRSNFLSTPLFPLDEVDLTQGVSTNSPTTALTAGVLFIEYDFTPRSISEPASLVMLVGGVAMIVGGRWTRKHRSQGSRGRTAFDRGCAAGPRGGRRGNSDAG